MADKMYYQEEGTGALRGWVLQKMMQGAGYAGLCLFVLLVTIWIIAGLGRLLPAESRETPDPTPESSISVPAGPTAFG
mgnify:CR=1 FL=1